MALTKFIRVADSGPRLTRRQRRFLSYLADYQKQNGVSPTFREISLALNMNSKGSISGMVNRLEEKGVISRDEKVVRGITVR